MYSSVLCIMCAVYLLDGALKKGKEAFLHEISRNLFPRYNQIRGKYINMHKMESFIFFNDFVNKLTSLQIQCCALVLCFGRLFWGKRVRQFGPGLFCLAKF